MNPIRATLCLFVAIPAFASAQYLASSKTTGPNLGVDNTTPAVHTWIREEDQVNGRITAARMSKMKSVTESIINIFKDSLIANDQYAALWHGEYYSEKMSPGPRMKFAAVCNFVEQHASLQVVANDLSPLMDHLVVDNTDFLTIRPVNTIKQGASYFEYYSADGELNKTWMITAAGQEALPYTAVTRKEYLNLAHTELVDTKAGILAGLKQQMPARGLAVQEAEKNAQLEKLKNMYTGAELDVRTRVFLQHYKTDQEYIDAAYKAQTAEIDSTIHYMESLLQHLPAKELEQPAIVSGAAIDFRGWEDAHGGKMLIRMNGAWSNGGAAVEKPRLFLVTLSYDAQEGQAAGLDRLINDRLNLQALQNMMD